MKLTLLLTVVLIMPACTAAKDWRSASRESAGIAPDPSVTEHAVVHVYGARAWGWRGWFAIHTWIATKRSGEKDYTVYDVVGWRARHGGSVMRIYHDIPDRFWYGEQPRLLKAHTGDGVDELIDAIDHSARQYPWKTVYKVLPGPNSNTFTAWIAKHVSELELELPITAIGKSYVD